MDKAILAGPFIGELGWECLRFAPHILWKLKRHKDTKLIVYTREDRFDLYGKLAHIMIPLNIEGDCIKYRGNCFRLDGYPFVKYEMVASKFKNKYKDRFDIVEHIYPSIGKSQFANKNQFSQKKMVHEFRPRQGNIDLVNRRIPFNKPIVVLGPRFRRGFRRNWPHWEILYDRIEKEFFDKFTFIICGKPPEYIPDPKGRFIDINDFPLNNNTSLIGLTIEIIKRSILVCGSQSAIPNLAMSLQTKTIQWGNQKKQHTKQYNIKNTPVIFHQDNKFRIGPDVIMKSLRDELKNKEKNNGKK